MDIWNTVTSFLPLVIDSVASPALTVVGGFALVASVFTKPESQYGEKIHWLINLLGANVNKAKNKD